MQVSTFTAQVSSQVSSQAISAAIYVLDDMVSDVQAKIAAKISTTFTYDNAVLAANWTNAQARFWLPLAKSVIAWSAITAIFAFFTLCQWAIESGRIVREGYDMGDLVQVTSDTVLAEMESDRRELSPACPDAIFPLAFFNTFVNPSLAKSGIESVWSAFKVDVSDIEEFVNSRQ